MRMGVYGALRLTGVPSGVHFWLAPSVLGLTLEPLGPWRCRIQWLLKIKEWWLQTGRYSGQAEFWLYCIIIGGCRLTHVIWLLHCTSYRFIRNLDKTLFQMPWKVVSNGQNWLLDKSLFVWSLQDQSFLIDIMSDGAYRLWRCSSNQTFGHAF